MLTHSVRRSKFNVSLFYLIFHLFVSTFIFIIFLLYTHLLYSFINFITILHIKTGEYTWIVRRVRRYHRWARKGGKNSNYSLVHGLKNVKYDTLSMLIQAFCERITTFLNIWWLLTEHFQ